MTWSFNNQARQDVPFAASRSPAGMEAHGSLPTGPFGWVLLLVVSMATGFSLTRWQ